MMLETAFIAARDRKRLTDIASVLLTFGAHGVVSALGLGGLVPVGRGADDQPTTPERLRAALEALGPTFVKLGQILSTRGDLLPPDWTTELEKLQSAVAPEPFAAIRSQVEEDLGCPPEEAFAAFDATPLAAGSIAQVHRARLKTGEDVVVKVLRPNLRPMIEADLRLLGHAAAIMEKQWPHLARYRPREVAAAVGAALREELDLNNEARHGEDAAAAFARRPDVRIPGVHRAYSSERLLVQDYLDGVSPNDPAAIRAAGLDGAVLAERGAQAFLQMVLLDGVFHADPHPGNVRALAENRIGFLDFGMVGKLSPRRRTEIVRLVSAIVRGDSAALASVVLDLAGGPDVDVGRLEAACDAFIARHGHAHLQLGAAIQDFLALARDNALALPADLALLFKALATADGVMRKLDPAINLVATAKPLVASAMRARLTPMALLEQSQTLALDLHAIASDAPALVRLIMRRLREGKLKAQVDLVGIDRLGSDLNSAATRIGVAIVTAAFAISLGPRLIEHGPRVWDIPLMGLIGGALIVTGMAWLIWPSRRR